MGQPIRVLHVVNTMNIIGGYEALIMNIYRNIDREKVQFDFLTHGGVKGTFDDEILSLGGRIHAMPAIKDEKRAYYWRYFAYKKALKGFFAAHHEYKVLHGHMTNTASIYVPIAREYGAVARFIAHSHQSRATPGLSGVASRILQRGLHKLADECFSCSETASHWLFPQEYIDSGRVKIIKNGIDPKRFYYDEKKRAKVRAQLGVDGKLVIGNVGKFKTEKNHPFLIDIFKELRELNSNAVLVLVGDGESKGEIEKKVERLGLSDSVIFTGMRSDVADLMQGFDLFLLPSLREGLPVVGVEAQATGLPIVTSTGVSEEMDITDNVTHLDQSLGAEAWARKILDVSESFVRRDMTDYIKSNGYDITDTASYLQDYYLRYGS